MAKTTAIYPSIKDLIIKQLEKEGHHEIASIVSELPPHDNDNNVYYAALGLSGEVGEFCNKLKKVMRDNDGIVSDEFRGFAADEIGDILWYVAAICSELDIDMMTCAAHNLNKLKSRQMRGKLVGSGDNR
ncbi:MAG: hypothetical protein GF411_19990 [Candidatus Lokiarchaeota archaeon]|nr:hypothetical protein [Candidatus Lokiarchaeota archaeon]